MKRIGSRLMCVAAITLVVCHYWHGAPIVASLLGAPIPLDWALGLTLGVYLTRR